MSGQEARGSVGDYQADEQAGVARLSWRVSKHICFCLFVCFLRDANQPLNLRVTFQNIIVVSVFVFIFFFFFP